MSYNIKYQATLLVVAEDVPISSSETPLELEQTTFRFGISSIPCVEFFILDVPIMMAIN
jgi:hypothetical protein